MTAREELEAIPRNWAEAYNAKDYARLAELLTPDLVLEDVGMGLILEGGDNFVDGIREVAETAAPDRRLSVDSVYADPEAGTVLFEGRWSGTFEVEKWGNAPGTRHSHRSCTVLKVRDGRIARFTDYTCSPKESEEAA